MRDDLSLLLPPLAMQDLKSQPDETVALQLFAIYEKT